MVLVVAPGKIEFQSTTSDGLCISLQLGGVGVLHYNCSISEQAAMVAAVKRYRPGHIPQPWVLPPSAKIEDFLAIEV
jgi:IMP dehydrogenase